jgi:hypothetical protein
MNTYTVIASVLPAGGRFGSPISSAALRTMPPSRRQSSSVESIPLNSIRMA